MGSIWRDELANISPLTAEVPQPRVAEAGLSAADARLAKADEYIMKQMSELGGGDGEDAALSDLV